MNQRFFDELVKARSSLMKARQDSTDIPTEATYNHAIYGITQVLKMMKTQNPLLQGPSEGDTNGTR